MATNVKTVKIKSVQTIVLDELLNLALTTPEIHTQIGEPEYYSKKQLNGFIRNPDAIFLAAFIGKELVGFSLTTYDKFANEAYFVNMVIKDGYRRSGIGKKLYKQTLSKLSKTDCNWIWVLTEEENKKMQSFLEKHDFERGPKFVYYRKSLN